MKLYAVKCPCCRTINKVYLEETDGWMECENCLHSTNAEKMLCLLIREVPPLPKLI